MQTILQYNELLDLGFQISNQKKQSVVQNAIEEIELLYISRWFGSDLYCQLLEIVNSGAVSDDIAILLDGGIYTDEKGVKHAINGLKKAIANLAFANLLFKESVSVRYGTVNKKDAYSEKATAIEETEQAQKYRKIGMYYADEIICYCRTIESLKQVCISKEISILSEFSL